MKILPPLKNDCGECAGYGYDMFLVDREPYAEIQKADNCNCLPDRINWTDNDHPPTDDEALALFVHDLTTVNLAEDEHLRHMAEGVVRQALA